MSCADVCIDMGYDGSCQEFHWARTRTARKEHRCCECGRTIEPGENYEYTSAKDEGLIYTEKTCAECVEIRGALVCGSWYYGQLWEAIESEVFPLWQQTGPWDCLAKIDSEPARKLLLARWQEWKENR